MYMSIDQRVEVPLKELKKPDVEPVGRRYQGMTYDAGKSTPEGSIIEGQPYFSPKRVQTYGSDVTSE